MKVEKLLKNICKYSVSIKYETDEETFTKIYLQKFLLQAFLPLR